MIISNITPSQVWTASSRSLTNLGSSLAAVFNTQQTTIAAATSISFEPSVGILGFYGVVVKTGAAPTAAITIRYSDSTNVFIVATTAIATNAVASFTSPTTNAVFLQISNADAAVAGTYMNTGWNLTI